jgi:putative transposase
MARVARAVAIGYPYHMTHRGNHREAVFFDDGDRKRYLADFAEGAQRYSLDVWAYCLMPNHVHFLLVPRGHDAMAGAIRLAHGRHARRVHKERGWTGHLWANRYYSCCLDEDHLWRAVKYVELNPVRAGLAARAENWPWSSAPAHAEGRSDSILSATRPFPGAVADWAAWLNEGLIEEDMDRIRRHTRTSRPLGEPAFLDRLEHLIGRILRPLKRGPKPKQEELK